MSEVESQVGLLHDCRQMIDLLINQQECPVVICAGQGTVAAANLGARAWVGVDPVGRGFDEVFRLCRSDGSPVTLAELRGGNSGAMTVISCLPGGETVDCDCSVLSLETPADQAPSLFIRLRPSSRGQSKTDTSTFLRGHINGLFSDGPGVLFCWRSNGCDLTVGYISRSCQQVTGYAPAEIRHHPGTCLASLHPDDVDGIRAKWGELTHTDRVVFSGRFQHRQGAWHQFNAELMVAQRLADGFVEMVGFVYDVSDLKSTQQSLVRSESQYRLLAEHSTDMISRHAADDTVLFVSPACQTLLGYAPEEMVGCLAGKFIPEADHEEVWRSIRAAQATRDSFRMEMRMIKKEGAFVWVEVAFRLLKQPQTGELREILCATRDIGRRREIEQRLRDSEAYHRQLINTLPDGVTICDLQGRITYASPRAYEIYEAPVDFPILDSNILDWTHPDCRASVRATVKSILQGETPNEPRVYKLCKHTGGLFWGELYSAPLRDDLGQPKGLITVCRDISKRIAMEQALADSEQTARSLLDGNPGQAMLIGLDGTIIRLNESMARQLGSRFELLVGTDIFNYLHPDRVAAWRMHIREVCALGLSRRFEEEPRLGLVLDTIITPVLGMDGAILKLAVYCNDITAMHHARRDLNESRERLRAFAGRLQEVREDERTRIARDIHDVLAQELTRLKIDLTWLARRLAGQPGGAAGDELRAKVGTMVGLTDGIITTVQKIATEMRPVVLDSMGLFAAIEWQTEEFQQRTGVRCRVKVPRRELDLPVESKTGIFRILQESLTNVARHSGATQVAVHVGFRFQADDSGEPVHRILVLAVKDNGRGINLDQPDDPHCLGLLSMKERALLFGGQFEISGKPGRGTIVTVTMPLGAHARPSAVVVGTDGFDQARKNNKSEND